MAALLQSTFGKVMVPFKLQTMLQHVYMPCLPCKVRAEDFLRIGLFLQLMRGLMCALYVCEVRGAAGMCVSEYLLAEYADHDQSLRSFRHGHI